MRQNDEIISSTNSRPTVPMPASFFLFQMSILIYGYCKMWSSTLTIRNLSDCCRAFGFYWCTERAWLRMKSTMESMATQGVEHIPTRSGERAFDVYDLGPMGTVTTNYRSWLTCVRSWSVLFPALGGKRTVPGAKNVDLVAVTTLGETESSSALNVRRSLSTNPQTECGGQRTANAGGDVRGGDGFEELRTEVLTNRAKTDSLSSTSTSLISYDSRSFWQPTVVMWASSPGRDWDMTPIHKWGTGGLPDHSEANNVHTRPGDPHGI